MKRVELRQVLNWVTRAPRFRNLSRMQQSLSVFVIPSRPFSENHKFDRETEPESVEKELAGKHKSPMVDYLWGARGAVRKREAEQREKESEKAAAHKIIEAASAQLKAKTPSESFTKVTYPFATDTLFREKYVNPWGKIRVGRIVEDLDALAGTIAFRHAKDDDMNTDEYIIVTASIDRIVLGHRPNLKDDIDLAGQVSWVGTSSMEINMVAKSSWTEEPWMSALFTFVALDRNTMKPAALHQLNPETEEEKHHFHLGMERNNRRKRLRKEKATTKIQSKRKGIFGMIELI
mmetsp:Transcript_12837/g.14817  ORF Transcript_12837/g.14817 Transcript_12837/m.14817 type:complete len:291 (-) Transcript_12837:1843-2715(-)